MGKPQGSGTRKERLGSQVREVIAQVLLFEAKDPTLAQVNVTDVELTGDLGLAKVYYYAHNLSERERERLGQALERAKGFLRRRIGQEIHARITPELVFYYDDSIERGASIEAAIRQARAQDERLASEFGSPADEPAEEPTGEPTEASVDEASEEPDESWDSSFDESGSFDDSLDDSLDDSEDD